MKPEKEHLLDDLLDGQSRREATLRAGAHILRRRRHWRTARQTAAALLLVGIASILLVHKSRLQKEAIVPSAENNPALVQSDVLTDEQLLALFPKTPVGLVTLQNGKKMLIFPRPADDARYAVHL
jgi:hypothetical protein